jgi:hypothetical protein
MPLVAGWPDLSDLFSRVRHPRQPDRPPPGARVPGFYLLADRASGQVVSISL